MLPTPPAPLSADPAVDYVRAVEQCFLEIRGRGVLWSPLDASRALAWHGLGLTAGMTVRVLHARVTAWRFRHGAGARLPMHLGWYEPAVLEQTKHLRRTVADDGPLPTRDSGAVHGLTELLAALTVLAAEPGLGAILTHVYGKAFDWLDKGLHGVPADVDPDAPVAVQAVPDTDAVVEACRSKMTKLLRTALTDGQSADLEATLRADRVPAGTISRKAAAAREARTVELFLATIFAHRVPTRLGWQDPRDV